MDQALDFEVLRDLGGRLAECIRNTAEAERRSVGMRPVQNRLLARLVCPPVENTHQLQVPPWSYPMGPVTDEVLVLRDPSGTLPDRRERILRACVPEAWHRHASPLYGEWRKRIWPSVAYHWLLFPHVMRVALAMWIGVGTKRSLLVEYERAATTGGAGTIRLPGEFVEVDRKVPEHAQSVLQELHLWDGKSPDAYDWCAPSSEGITTLMFHRAIASLELNAMVEKQDARRLLLPRASWPHIRKRRFGGLKPFVQRVEGRYKKPYFTVADDVLDALRSAPKD